MLKGKPFRFCSKCGGIITLDNNCPICNEIKFFKSVNTLEPLLPLPVGLKKSKKVPIGEITETTELDVPSDKTSIQELETPRFLKIDEGDPLIWFQCPECDLKYRKVAVLTCKIDEKSQLYGDCNHMFKAILPSSLVEEILEKIGKKG